MKPETSRSARAPDRRARRAAAAGAALALSAAVGAARELDPRGWRVVDGEGRDAGAIADGRLETVWRSPREQRPGLALTLDLGLTCAVHRVYLTPGALTSCYPRGLRVWAGLSAADLRAVCAADLPREVETNLRFEPVHARFLKLEIAGDGAGYPWAVAEALAFGVPGDPALPRPHLVAVDPAAPPLVRRAAEDLRYYLTELTDLPAALVPPGPLATGAVFHVRTPAPLPPYERLVTDERYRRLETGRVRREGERIVFGGPTQLAVLYGVYEFLHRQGVRWVYPSALGDSVPSPRPLDLSCLPLEHAPSFERRYANWNTERHAAMPDVYLWYYRNRWNSSWGGEINERPDVPAPAARPSFGYTHTFATAVPGYLFPAHPDWFPLLRGPRYIPRIGIAKLGRRLPYEATWGLNFCTSNPEVVRYLIRRIEAASDPATVDGIAWLTPMDAGAFCECARCLGQDHPLQTLTPHWKGAYALSNRYLTFIAAVADGLRGRRPNLRVGAFAYEDYLQPPERWPRLPANVVVDVVQYGDYILPWSAPANAWMRETMEGWARRWDEPGHVGVYDWALLLESAKGMPVPLVSALCERMRAFRALGVRRIGTQADSEPEVWSRNPWNFYAYSRLLRDAEESPESILDDFFGGYYREAAGPMLAYYRALERHLLEHRISLGEEYHYRPSEAAFPDGLLREMSGHLRQARERARHWLIRLRVREAEEGFRGAEDRRLASDLWR